MRWPFSAGLPLSRVKLGLIALWLAAVFVGFPKTLMAQSSSSGELTSWAYLDALPPPVIRNDVGVQDFESSATPEAARFIAQGVALLHDFWELEAYRSFKHAAVLDPNAGMAYWGIYVALGVQAPRERAEERKRALRAAQRVMNGVTDRERRYIRSIVLLDSLGGSSGKSAYETELEQLMLDYSDDVDAALLLAKSVGYDQPYSRAIVATLMETHPRHHGVHHYWIHAQPRGYHERALASAELIAELAPAAGHIVHMPGHVFYFTGSYNRAADAFLASHQAESQYLTSLNIKPIDVPLALHNLNFLIMSLAEAGRFAEAWRWVDTLSVMAVMPEDRMGGAFATLLQGKTTAARLALRMGEWSRAARLLEEVDNPERYGAWATTYVRSLEAYARGMAALGDGDMRSAQVHRDALGATLWRAKRDNTLPGWTERLLAPTVMELEGWMKLTGGEVEDGLASLTAAVAAEKQIAGMRDPPYYARPTLQGLAEAFAFLERFDEARQVYERLSQEDRINSGYAAYGIARTWESEGKREQANDAYRRFLDAWSRADPETDMVIHAREYLDSATSS